MFSHVQRQPVAFFTRAQTGALVTRINTDVIGAQQAFTSTLSGVVSNVVSLVLVAGAMLTLSWPITLAALVLLPVFLVPARYVGRRLSGLTRQSMQLNADLATRSTERFNVAGALLVTLFGRRREEDEQFADRAAQVRDVGVQIAMIGRVFFTALTLVAALATALVYGVGGWLAASGTLTIGTLLALAALLGRLYGPITALANVRVDVMSALVSFERVFEILDLPALVQDPEVPRPVPSGPLAVELRDVTFRYPSADEVSLASLETVSGGDRDGSGPVLHDVSLRAEAGELVALVGPSGAGKTSITALVARLYDPQAGSVTVGGVDVRDVTLEDLHDRVGVVTQEAHMFHDTVRANLLYARPDATDAQLEDALRDAQVLDLVRSLPRGLDTVVGDRGHRLSGGEKQRLALARLLLKAPSVVVLDEATAHLDSESEAAVQRALDTALEGRTALVIAHRLSTVRGADQIVVVDRGRIVDRGKHAELLARGGLYAELYRTQFSDYGRSRTSSRPPRRPPSRCDVLRLTKNGTPTGRNDPCRPDRTVFRPPVCRGSDGAEHAAVDGERGAGDVAGRGGEQEDRGAGELLRVAVAAQGDVRLGLPADLGRVAAAGRVELADAVGVDPPGEHGVDADRTGAELVRQRLGDHRQAGTQPVGDGQAADRRADRGREHEQDRAALGADAAGDRLGGADGPEEDAVEGGAPVVVARLQHRAGWRAADADQRAVEPAETADGRGDALLRRLGVGEVDRQGQHAVRRAELVGGCGDRLAVARGHHQAGTLVGEQLGARLAEATRGAGDDVHAVVEAEIHEVIVPYPLSPCGASGGHSAFRYTRSGGRGPSTRSADRLSAASSSASSSSSAEGRRVRARARGRPCGGRRRAGRTAAIGR